MFRTTILAVLATTVVGCAPMAEQAAVQSATSSIPPFNQANLTAVREYVMAGEILPKPTAGKPVAYVMLDENDRGRNLKICEQFETLQTQAGVDYFGTPGETVPTYWFLTLPAKPTGRDRCEDMVDYFDYERAIEAANAAKVPRMSSAYILAFDGKDSFYINLDNGSKKRLRNALNSWFTIAAANPGEPGTKLKGWLQIACGKGFAKEFERVSTRFDEAQLVPTEITGGSSVGEMALDYIPYARPGIEVVDRVCKLVYPSNPDSRMAAIRS